MLAAKPSVNAKKIGRKNDFGNQQFNKNSCYISTFRILFYEGMNANIFITKIMYRNPFIRA